MSERPTPKEREDAQSVFVNVMSHPTSNAGIDIIAMALRRARAQGEADVLAVAKDVLGKQAWKDLSRALAARSAPESSHG